MLLLEKIGMLIIGVLFVFIMNFILYSLWVKKYIGCLYYCIYVSTSMSCCTTVYNIGLTDSMIIHVKAMEMIRTHPKFISFDPRVRSANALIDIVGYALKYQTKFQHKTSGWEPALDHGFHIRPDKIDRLYNIRTTYNNECATYYLLVRIEAGDHHIFAELFANCSNRGFDCDGNGVIEVTEDPAYLCGLMITWHEPGDIIRFYKLLQYDGYVVPFLEQWISLLPRNALYRCGIWNKVKGIDQ